MIVLDKITTLPTSPYGGTSDPRSQHSYVFDPSKTQTNIGHGWWYLFPSVSSWAKERIILFALCKDQSELVELANFPQIQYFHYELPSLLNSNDPSEIIIILLALYNLERVISPSNVCTSVHLTDDLQNLLDCKWVWSRKELIRRLCTALAWMTLPVNAPSNLVSILRQTFPRPTDDSESFWVARLRDRQSSQDALETVRRRGLIPWESFETRSSTTFELTPKYVNIPISVRRSNTVQDANAKRGLRLSILQPHI